MADKNSTSQSSALIEAICNHDLTAFEHVMQTVTSADLDRCDERGFTPLLWAVREELFEAVEQLLAAGANPNLGDNRVGYPLSSSLCWGEQSIAKLLLKSSTLDLPWQGFIAAYDSLMAGRLATLDCLLEHGFDVSWPVPPQTGIRGVTDCASALLFGTISIGLPRPEVFERLIALGANPNACSDGDSLVGRLCARANEAPDVLRLLLQNGVNINSLDATGYAPLHYAAARDHQDSVRMLLEFGANPDLKANDGSVPLIWAASNGLGKVHPLLLETLQSTTENSSLQNTLPSCWDWDGGATWGALELAVSDGAWHAMLWADDEEKLLARLQQRHASLRDNSPLCLVIRQLQSPQNCTPMPYLHPGQSNIFKVDQVCHLHYYAPWFPHGISRPLGTPAYHRFIMTNEPITAAQNNATMVTIHKIVSFHEGHEKDHTTAQCEQDRQHWRLVPGGKTS